MFCLDNTWNDYFKINKVVKKFFADWRQIYGAELHLRQPGFTCGTCETYTKHRETVLKVKETSDLNYICKNKLDKDCFPITLCILIVNIKIR